jgi:ribosomal protein S2
MWEFSYNYLVSFSVHIGHSIKNSSPFCAWMVLAKRQDILLINLFKWTFMMHWGLSVFEAAVISRSPVWFVSLDPIKSAIVRLSAMYCGEFNVTSGWISGMLSNYYMICLSWAKNRSLAAFVRPTLQKRLSDIYDHWMLTRISWPRAVFLCGVQKSFRVARESIKARIPCVSIADTLGGHQALSLAVPGNDDTMDSIYFHNFLSAKTILRKKYALVFAWYYHVRQEKRLGNFERWFALMSAARKKKQQSYNYLLWNNNKGFSERSTKYSLKQSSFLSTVSLLNAIMAATRIHAPIKGFTQPWEYYENENQELELDLKAPSYYETFINFGLNSRLNGALLRLSFLHATTQALQDGMKHSLRTIRPLHPYLGAKIRNGFKYKTNFLTKRHQFFDLLTPTIRFLTNVGKKGVVAPNIAKEIVFRKSFHLKKSKVVQFGRFKWKLYKILSSFLLMVALFTRLGAKEADSYLGLHTYKRGRRSRYYRRLLRETEGAKLVARDDLNSKLWGNSWKKLKIKAKIAYQNIVPKSQEPVLRARGFFSNIYYLFLTRLAFMARAPRPSGHARINFIKKPWHQRISSIALENNSLIRKYFFRNLRSRDRSVSSLLYFRNITTLAVRINRRLPGYLIETALEEKRKADQGWKFMKKVNKRSKIFQRFKFSNWVFNSMALPRLYWGSPMYYLPKVARPLDYKFYERNSHKKAAYPLFKETLLLINKC